MHDEIRLALEEVEKNNNCKVLFACESGSRAWGFPSPDSDYDIRFIYVNKLNWYLRLDEKSDVINLMLPHELDLSGWDLRKTLQLFAKCNLCLNEWLGSPVVYHKDKSFFDAINPLIPYYFNAKKALHHYLSTAEKIVTMHFTDDLISIKKLFYVIRPILACLWILQYNSMPPTNFKELLNENFISNGIRELIVNLTEIKFNCNEQTKMQVPESLLSWIDLQILTVKNTSYKMINAGEVDLKLLNDIMISFAS